VLLFGLALFTLSVPHSIAAAQISSGIAYLAWLVRDLPAGRLRFARTPADRPLLCFAALSALSALLSVEPRESLPKLRTLTLFLIIYLVTTNLHPRGARLFAGLLVASGLLGVGFSVAEKVTGRGMVIAAIAADSPLRASALREGDVIWMIGRRRVTSPEGAARAIRREPAGKRLSVEALHEGDPIPVTLEVTEELKARANPLGVSAAGRSRRFRVSGFSRQFLTYAEQMQIFALLAFGVAIAGLRARRWLIVALGLASLFSLALILTASRAVIASFLLALLAVAGLTGGRRVALAAIAAVLALGAFSVYVLTGARTPVAASFADDSSARRLAYMRAGLRLIPEHPLLGVGADAHKHHWREWGFPGDYVTHTHSTPIQIALDRGLPALGCYVWLMAALLLMTWRGYRGTGNPQAGGLMLGAFGALIGFSASSLANYNFGDSEVVMLLLAVVGLALAAGKKSGQQSAAKSGRARSGHRVGKT